MSNALWQSPRPTTSAEKSIVARFVAPTVSPASKWFRIPHTSRPTSQFGCITSSKTIHSNCSHSLMEDEEYQPFDCDLNSNSPPEVEYHVANRQLLKRLADCCLLKILIHYHQAAKRRSSACWDLPKESYNTMTSCPKSATRPRQRLHCSLRRSHAD